MPSWRIFPILIIAIALPHIHSHSLTSDIKGGVEYGIDTCWLNPKGKEVPEGMDITYIIKDIRDVLEILE